MPIAASWSETLFWPAAAFITFAITALAAYTFGRRIARRSRFLAVLACAAVVPLLITAIAIFFLVTTPVGPQPTDASGMAFAVLVMFAAFSGVISLPASAILIFTQKRDSVG